MPSIPPKTTIVNYSLNNTEEIEHKTDRVLSTGIYIYIYIYIYI